MTTRLLVFANAFPFGTWEPYLMRETDFYDRFDEVYIFSLSVRDEQMQHPRPLGNAKIRVVPLEFKSRSFYFVNLALSLFNRAMWAEIRSLISTGRFSIARLTQVLVFFSRADHEARVISKFIRKNISDSPHDKSVLYAYRFLYQPYLIGKLARRFHSAKLVARAHRADLYEDEASTNFLPWRRGSMETLDELHLIAEHGVKYISKTIPGFDHKLKLSYLGTEDRGIADTSRSRSTLRIVTCSTATPVKRLALLADALSLLPPEVDVDWTHYGDGILLDELRELSAGMGRNITVKWMGNVENQVVLDDYKAGKYHVIVNVSSSEGLPVSLMEACSFGIPAIATDVGGTSEIIRDGENGILLGSDPSTAEVSQALLTFATMDDEPYEKFSKTARVIWEREFDSQANYSRFVERLIAE